MLTALLLTIQSWAFSQKPLAVIPFEEVHNSIILKIKLNNSPRVLRLLFDTGANGMALGKDLADSIGIVANRESTASVVGGHQDISISEGNTVHFENGFEFKNQSIAIFPKLSKGFDGLIGNIITRHYVVQVDFNKYELSLYDFDQYQPDKSAKVVPISGSTGLFIIPGNLEIVQGKSYPGNFVFDTGAGYNLICFRPFVRQNRLLVSGFKSDYHASTISMGMSTPTFNGKAQAFSFANTATLKQLPVTLMAGGGQSENWNPGFDGSIGMGIISRYNFAINLKKKEIYLQANHSHNYPQAFIVDRYLLGFNTKAELEIQSPIKAVKEGSHDLPKGTKIIRINGIDAKTIRTSTKALEKITSIAETEAIELTYQSANGPQKIQLR